MLIRLLIEIYFAVLKYRCTPIYKTANVTKETFNCSFLKEILNVIRQYYDQDRHLSMELYE